VVNQLVLLNLNVLVQRTRKYMVAAKASEAAEAQPDGTAEPETAKAS
jgi:hypothetical protein